MISATSGLLNERLRCLGWLNTSVSSSVPKDDRSPLDDVSVEGAKGLFNDDVVVVAVAAGSGGGDDEEDDEVEDAAGRLPGGGSGGSGGLADVVGVTRPVAEAAAESGGSGRSGGREAPDDDDDDDDGGDRSLVVVGRPRRNFKKSIFISKHLKFRLTRGEASFSLHELSFISKQLTFVYIKI